MRATGYLLQCQQQHLGRRTRSARIDGPAICSHLHVSSIRILAESYSSCAELRDLVEHTQSSLPSFTGNELRLEGIHAAQIDVPTPMKIAGDAHSASTTIAGSSHRRKRTSSGKVAAQTQSQPRGKLEQGQDIFHTSIGPDVETLLMTKQALRNESPASSLWARYVGHCVK